MFLFDREEKPVAFSRSDVILIVSIDQWRGNTTSFSSSFVGILTAEFPNSYTENPNQFLRKMKRETIQYFMKAILKMNKQMTNTIKINQIQN